jgi:ribosomal protein S18 acetylase RimI-like enzyme
MTEPPPRRRLKLIARLGPAPIEDRADTRMASPADRQALANLLLAAYAGTIDDEGETPAEALAEIERTLGGAYGPYLEPCSFLAEVDGRVVAASLITRWAEAPLVAFVMIDPRFQRRGLGERLLRRSMAALWSQGERELLLFVTEGNTPAQRLYERLGFAVVAPAGLG